MDCRPGALSRRLGSDGGIRTCYSTWISSKTLSTKTHGQYDCQSTGKVNGVPVYGGDWFGTARSGWVWLVLLGWWGDNGKAGMPSPGQLAFATRPADSDLMAADMRATLALCVGGWTVDDHSPPTVWEKVQGAPVWQILLLLPVDSDVHEVLGLTTGKILVLAACNTSLAMFILPPSMGWVSGGPATPSPIPTVTSWTQLVWWISLSESVCRSPNLQTMANSKGGKKREEAGSLLLD